MTLMPRLRANSKTSTLRWWRKEDLFSWDRFAFCVFFFCVHVNSVFKVAGAIEDIKPAKEIIDDMVKVAIQTLKENYGMITPPPAKL
jgi:hypothetical protein